MTTICQDCYSPECQVEAARDAKRQIGDGNPIDRCAELSAKVLALGGEP